MPTLLLIRGLPGSGKTTLARTLLNPYTSGVHLEADMFFLNKETGKYEMDEDRLPEAHRWCLDTAIKELRAGKNVIVSNTFTTFRRLQDYFDILWPEDKCTVVSCTGNFPSIHNPPPHVMERMRDNWEPNDSIRKNFTERYSTLPSPNFFVDKDLELHA